MQAYRMYLDILSLYDMPDPTGRDALPTCNMHLNL